jgi:hypothetical protein
MAPNRGPPEGMEDGGIISRETLAKVIARKVSKCVGSKEVGMVPSGTRLAS